jgi:type IX secretion system PorP/SprF family membrane protein
MKVQQYIQHYFKPIIAVIVVSGCFALPAFSQDAHFSQYYASGLYLNPSLAGVESNLTFTSNFRQQWRSVAQPFVTNQISVISPVNRGKILKKQIGGAGLSLYNDRAGDGNFKTTGLNLSAAYNTYFREDIAVLSVGGQVGFVQKSIDMTNLEWGSMYNTSLGKPDLSSTPDVSGFSNRRNFLDINAGATFFYNPQRDYNRSGLSGHFGVAAYHLNQPNESFFTGTNARLPMLFKAHGHIDIRANERFSFAPALLFMHQRGLNQINAGVYLNYRMFSMPTGILAETDVVFGAWHRLQDAFILMGAVSNSTFTLGLSYDLNSSSLRQYSGGRGAFEVSLAVRNVKERSRQRFDTPRI